MLIQAAMYLVIFFILVGLYQTVNVDMLFGGSGTRSFQNPIARELIGRSQIRRLEAALEIYRLEIGKYPEKLDQLVQVGLVAKDELRYPWHNPHVYQRRNDGYVLLRPFE
jgi:hypothetical protein